MTLSQYPNELIVHLQNLSGLETRKVQRLVDEVLSFFDESLEVFVTRRHRELQSDGYTNTAIYEHLAREIRQRPFAVGILSERQIRRLIYG